MKRSRLNKIGSIGRANLYANERLIEIFTEKNIWTCEIQLAGCLGAFTTAFAHRHKRIWYRRWLEKLYDFKQVVLGCVNCHNKIENNSKLTEEVFMRLRGEE